MRRGRLRASRDTAGQAADLPPTPVEVTLDALEYLTVYAPWRQTLGISWPISKTDVEQIIQVRNACERHVDEFIRAAPECGFWDRKKRGAYSIEELRIVTRYCANRQRPAQFAAWCKAKGHITRSIAA